MPLCCFCLFFVDPYLTRLVRLPRYKTRRLPPSLTEEPYLSYSFFLLSFASSTHCILGRPFLYFFWSYYIFHVPSPTFQRLRPLLFYLFFSTTPLQHLSTLLHLHLAHVQSTASLCLTLGPLDLLWSLYYHHHLHAHLNLHQNDGL